MTTLQIIGWLIFVIASGTVGFLFGVSYESQRRVREILKEANLTTERIKRNVKKEQKQKQQSTKSTDYSTKDECPYSELGDWSENGLH